MTTDSSILDWRIPWTEELGGLQSMGSQRWTGMSDFSTAEQMVILFYTSGVPF